jgi:cob(I)alamin adenosyltransferase
MNKSKPKPSKPVKKDKWQVLVRLIQSYADAQQADSWKGGGDPSEVEVHEARLVLARAELNAWIEQTKRELE